MAKQTINIGVQGNDGTGYSIRDSFRIVNENFDEVYGALGISGGIRFTNLVDGAAYTANQLIVASTDGSRLTARDVVAGAGITIDKTSNTQIVISAPNTKLTNDSTPTLSAPLNASGFGLGKVPMPSSTIVSQFNSTFPNSPTTINELAAPVQYVDASIASATANTKFITASGTRPSTAVTTVAGTLDVSSGTVKVTSLTTGASTSPGNIVGTWTVALDSSITAANADLAEFYSSDAEYEPGTVVVFGGDFDVTVSSTLNDTAVAGVVTTSPAFVMNEGLTGTRVALALAGRVPCKVVGRVNKGDLLTTSATPGCACRAINPTLGSIIGKSLVTKDFSEVGIIEIAVGRM